MVDRGRGGVVGGRWQGHIRVVGGGHIRVVGDWCGVVGCWLVGCRGRVV